jgi:hypothetical protein
MNLLSGRYSFLLSFFILLLLLRADGCCVE